MTPNITKDPFMSISKPLEIRANGNSYKTALLAFYFTQ